jgi:hypothetical protein
MVATRSRTTWQYARSGGTAFTRQPMVCLAGSRVASLSQREMVRGETRKRCAVCSAESSQVFMKTRIWKRSDGV